MRRTSKRLTKLFLEVMALNLALLLSNCASQKVVLIPDSRVPVALPPELQAKYGQWGVTSGWMKDRIDFELWMKERHENDTIALIKCR